MSWNKTGKIKNIKVSIGYIRAFMPIDDEGNYNDESIDIKATLPCELETRTVLDPDHGTEIQEQWIPVRPVTEEEKNIALQKAKEYVKQNDGEIIEDIPVRWY